MKDEPLTDEEVDELVRLNSRPMYVPASLRKACMEAGTQELAEALNQALAKLGFTSRFDSRRPPCGAQVLLDRRQPAKALGG